jgi:hypothetical protein
MYETEKGLEFIVEPNDENEIQTQMDSGNFRLAFHFQTVDCACIYAVTNKNTWLIDMQVYRHLRKNPYTRRTLLKLLLLGHFDIGVMRIGNYGIINDIKSYNDDENSEIRLHYTEPKTTRGNVAWRSIKWDLFGRIVDEMNEEVWRQAKEAKLCKFTEV